jgi:hypothetical protein
MNVLFNTVVLFLLFYALCDVAKRLCGFFYKKFFVKPQNAPREILFFKGAPCVCEETVRDAVLSARGEGDLIFVNCTDDPETAEILEKIAFDYDCGALRVYEKRGFLEALENGAL